MDDHLLRAPSCQVQAGPVPQAAACFKTIFANTYILLFQTQRAHWCAVGPAFYSVHQMTQMQYESLFESIDLLAERMRALGEFPPVSLADLVDQSDLAHASAGNGCLVLLEELCAAHAYQSQMCRDHIRCCEASNDSVTADLLTSLGAFHEKALWMIRATLQS